MATKRKGKKPADSEELKSSGDGAEASDAPDTPNDDASKDKKKTRAAKKSAAGSEKKKAPPPEDDERDESADDADDDEADDDAEDTGADDVLASVGADALDRLETGDDDSDDDDEGDDEAEEAAQLGIERYVLATFFAGGMLFAYLLGRTVHAFWAYFSTRDWFSQALPSAVAIADDTKLTYATIFGGVMAIFAVFRSYRSERFRGWVNEVASELAKCKWPSKKEVTNYTVTVLAAAAIATTYLALLDRFWGFVTNIIYGTGT